MGEGVIRSTDGVVLRAGGLAGAAQGELLRLDGGGVAVVVALERSAVVAALLAGKARAGEGVRGAGSFPESPAGEALLGRVIDPLGNPLDGRAAPAALARRLGQRRPMSRGGSHALMTGIKWLDLIDPLPAGGWRPLLGPAGVGKSALALELILGRARAGGRCVLVAIGAGGAASAGLWSWLIERGAAASTTLVVAQATEPSASWLLAPLAGGALAEALAGSGGDVLLVLDGLERYGAALGELRAALGQPPSWRGAPLGLGQALAEALGPVGKQGAGSVTVVPVVSTGQAPGDAVAWELVLAGGRPYRLDPELRLRGRRPPLAPPAHLQAHAFGLPRVLRRLASSARITMAQLRELRYHGVREGDRRISYGERLEALLRQAPAAPVAPIELAALLVALNRGLFDDVAPGEVPSREQALLGWLRQGGRLVGVAPTEPQLDDSLGALLATFPR